MLKNISKDTIERWLKGWSLSRELPLPTKFKSGFKVDVGYEKQKIRYVFPNPSDDFIELANSITEPWVFLKVCATPDTLKNLLPQRWVIQPQGYMMTNSQRMIGEKVNLNDQYKIEFEQYDSTYVIKIIANNGDMAAIGRVVLVDDLAIYDRISTDVNHKRKGLATVLMKELEKIALAKGIHQNFLVATEEGKLLYESLGWKLSCFYTSIVIPDN
ncbi:GNAT family N-acetyltransferase [Flavobacterium aestivum]|uniref:GNAT family N-acetyltransferase n=1 Tax=Flavobacterium aestivum TaxID=3003257 RepID=UPI002285E439|nr:GNAT family N-acetyltransferase [Flavobacterium aestivum]